MNIERIGGVGPLYGPKKPNKPNNIEPSTSQQDKIEISEEARIRNLINIIQETSKAKEIDPGRLEKLKEVKEKLQNGYYDNLDDEILLETAKRMFQNSRNIILDLKHTSQ